MVGTLAAGGMMDQVNSRLAAEGTEGMPEGKPDQMILVEGDCREEEPLASVFW